MIPFPTFVGATPNQAALFAPDLGVVTLEDYLGVEGHLPRTILVSLESGETLEVMGFVHSTPTQELLLAVEAGVNNGDIHLIGVYGGHFVRVASATFPGDPLDVEWTTPDCLLVRHIAPPHAPHSSLRLNADGSWTAAERPC